jgi:hypothetical protein
MFADVDPVSIPVYESLLIAHHALRLRWRQMPTIIRALGLLIRKHEPTCMFSGWIFEA